MASFENPRSSSLGCTQKQSLKRVEHSVNKFTKIIVPADLERLNQHKVNIDMYRQQLEWDKVNNEQINASRTVQQLKCNIREMQKLRNQISDADVHDFDMRVRPTQILATDAVINFVGENEEVDNLFSCNRVGDLGIFDPGECGVRHRQLTASQESSSNMDEPENSIVTLTQTQEQSKFNEASQESWRHLQQVLLELNSLIHEFALVVKSQGEPVNNIEEHIDNAQSNVHKGTLHLLKATRFKAAILPVTGAIAGGLVGGPIGLCAGMKVGLVATGSGAVLGYVGGRVLKNNINRSNDIALTEIPQRQALIDTEED